VKRNLHVFLDTSALFSAIYSEAGGARLILKMGEIQVISLWVGNKVLRETDSVLTRKSPKSRPLFAFLLDQARIRTGSQPTAEHLRQAAEIVDHEPDAQVIAEALAADTDYMVSFDRKHLIDNPKVQMLPFPIGTAGDFLAWYQQYHITEERG
jgi:predicted nucleic acid-binding protein